MEERERAALAHSYAIATAPLVWPDRALIVTVCLLPLTIYLGAPTRDFYWDGIGLSQAIETTHGLNSSLLHPNHLIYNVLGYLAYRAALSCGVHARAVQVLQVLNSLLGASTVAVMYGILRKLPLSKEVSVIIALMFAFSATWWKFCTDADAYIPAVLLLMLCSRVLICENPRPHLLAAAHTMAMLLHELAILFAPAAIFALLRQTRGQKAWIRCQVLAMYLLESAGFTLGSYAIAFQLSHSFLSFRGVFDWAASRSAAAQFSLDPTTGLPYVLRGSIRLLFATSFDALRCRHSCIIYRSALLAGCLISVAAALAIHTRLRPDHAPMPRLKWLKIFAFIWIGAYVLFLVFWEPRNTFYRLFYEPPLFLMAALGLRNRNNNRQIVVVLAALLVLTFVLNFEFLILPASRIENNWALVTTRELQHKWNGKTTVYYRSQEGASIFDWTVRYFNPGTRWAQLPQTVSELESQLDSDALSGRSVWMDTSAMEQSLRDPGFRSWLDAHATNDEVRYSRGNYELWYRRVRP